MLYFTPEFTPEVPSEVSTQIPRALQSEAGLAGTGWMRAWSPSGVFLDYVALTKPKIIALLLVTALGGMCLAARGVPATTTVLMVLAGGGLAAGGANALNHYLDRDIDERMSRTRRRPLPGGRIDPRQALLFGLLLNAVAFSLLASWVNLLSATLTLGATVFYVLVYTSWLKRSTAQNIVIGGAAGAVPPVVGWAAVTGGLELPALYLFAIVFFWTPPHFWALALLMRDDYARAGVPMMPVVLGVEQTVRSIMLHSLTLVALTLLLFTVDGLGWPYLYGAMALGLGFLYLAWRLLTMSGARPQALRLYLYSLVYLTGLFALIIVDSTV